MITKWYWPEDLPYDFRERSHFGDGYQYSSEGVRPDRVEFYIADGRGEYERHVDVVSGSPYHCVRYRDWYIAIFQTDSDEASPEDRQIALDLCRVRYGCEEKEVT